MTNSKNNFKYSILLQKKLDNPINDFEFALKRINTETQEVLFCAIDEKILSEHYNFYEIINLEKEIDKIIQFISQNLNTNSYSTAKKNLKTICYLTERYNCEIALKDIDIVNFFDQDCRLIAGGEQEENFHLLYSNKEDHTFQDILSDMFLVISEENPDLVFV